MQNIPQWAWIAGAILLLVYLYKNGFLDNLLKPKTPVIPTPTPTPLPIPIVPTPDAGITIRHVVQTTDGKVTTTAEGPDPPSGASPKVLVTGGTISLEEKDGVIHVTR